MDDTICVLVTTDLCVYWFLSGVQCHLNPDLASELTCKILACVCVYYVMAPASSENLKARNLSVSFCKLMSTANELYGERHFGDSKPPTLEFSFLT